MKAGKNGVIRRREERVKTAILRGVYRDNMRMMGRESFSPTRNKLQTILLIGLVLLLAVSTYMYVSRSTGSASTISNRLDLQPARPSIPPLSQLTTPEPGADKATPAQYNTFLADLGIPLRRIFGLKVKTIILDPGHGGEDPGAMGQSSLREKDITLDIARRLRDQLKKNTDYRIFLTREDDITLSLEDRIDFANAIGGDLYVSIHINSIPDRPINVIETYYFGANSNPQTLFLAEKENQGSEYTMSDFKEIIQKIGNTMKTQESLFLARSIQNSLYRNIRRDNNTIIDFGVKPAPFMVLLGVDTPSVLTEVSCLSDEKEETKLKQESYRKKISMYLAEGIVNYLDKNDNLMTN